MVRKVIQAEKGMKLHDLNFNSSVKQKSISDFVSSDSQIETYLPKYQRDNGYTPSNHWRIYADKDGNDQMQMWVNKPSFSIGDEISIHAIAKQQQDCNIELIRLGYLDKLGGELVLTNSTTIPEGELWSESPVKWKEWKSIATIPVTEDLIPGMYVCKLVGKEEKSILYPFVIKEQASSFRTAVFIPWLSHQCLNYWGGMSGEAKVHKGQLQRFRQMRRDLFGKYAQPSLIKLDFNRPFFNGRGGDLLKYVHRVIASLEKEGVDYAILTDYDIVNGESLRKFSDVIVAGRLRYLESTVVDHINTAKKNGLTFVFLDAIHQTKLMKYQDNKLVIEPNQFADFNLPLRSVGPLKFDNLEWDNEQIPHGTWDDCDEWKTSTLESGWIYEPVIKCTDGQTVGLFLKSPTRAKLFLLGWSGWNSWFDSKNQLTLPKKMHDWLYQTLEQPLVSSKHEDEPLVSVIMTAYNSEDTVEYAVRSILQQTYRNLMLTVVDDCSSDRTYSILQELCQQDNRLKVIRNPINRGTYWSKNYGILNCKGDLITTQDSDDIASPSRIAVQVREMLSKPDCVASTVDYERRETDLSLVLNRGMRQRIAFQTMMWKRNPVLHTIGYFDSVRTSADEEFYKRINNVFKGKMIKIRRPLYHAIVIEGSLTMQADNMVELDADDNSHLSGHRLEYLEAFSEWHSTLNQQSPLMRYPLTRRRFDVPERLKIQGWPIDDHVTISMASFPPRQEVLEVVVRRLLPQVDTLNIYLNDYEEVPDFLIHEKINAVLSKDAVGDLRDNGKFFFLKEMKPGYHITVDDDILYPVDYVAQLILKVEQYGRNAIVGVHGVNLEYPLERFFKNRTVYNFIKSHDRDCFVNLLGTGTVCYHTSTIDMRDFQAEHTGMADVYLSLKAYNENIPMVCIQRPSDWMQELSHGGDTLWEEFKIEDSIQTGLANQVANWHQVEYKPGFTEFCKSLLENHNSIQLLSMGYDVLALTRIALPEYTGIQSLGE